MLAVRRARKKRKKMIQLLRKKLRRLLTPSFIQLIRKIRGKGR